MELITIRNRRRRFRGFVYQRAHFSADKKSIGVELAFAYSAWRTITRIAWVSAR